MRFLHRRQHSFQTFPVVQRFTLRLIIINILIDRILRHIRHDVYWSRQISFPFLGHFRSHQHGDSQTINGLVEGLPLTNAELFHIALFDASFKTKFVSNINFFFRNNIKSIRSPAISIRSQVLNIKTITVCFRHNYIGDLNLFVLIGRGL